MDADFSKNFKAKKSLGQNFLDSPEIVAMMVGSAKINPNDIVLEVGPGKGILTEKLLETGAKIIAIEKDDRAIPFLNEKFKKEVGEGKLKIIHGDILEFSPEREALTAGNYLIVANIPYYISGEFLRKFLESDANPSKMAIMLQKELAQRIVDEKGSILSISVKAYGNPEFIGLVSRKFFRPAPNVDSAIILIDNISKKFFSEGDGFRKISEKSFFEVVKAGFAHKRKVLIKNLEIKIAPDLLKKLWEEKKWSKTLRAEELKLDDWMKIAKLI